MLPTQWIGALYGLASAVSWGSGDYVGGLASRRLSQYQVVALAALTGLALFVPIGLLRGEAAPSTASVLWAAAAGASGAVGVTALYTGLVRGPAALVAPTATVVGAGLPVVLGAVFDRLPTASQGAGIVLGLAGIWMVSRPSTPGGKVERAGLFLALAAGAGFGGYFILIAQVAPGPIFLTLSVAKAAALVLSGLVVAAKGDLRLASRSNPMALLTGVLDGGGNLFNLLAAQQAGVAIAAVLSSMAPAITVLLSVWRLGEPLHRAQAIGVLLCLSGVGLIFL